MMAAPIKTESRVGETFPFLARVRVESTGEWASTDNISTITVDVWNEAGTQTVTAAELTPVATYVKSRLVVEDPRWADLYDGDSYFEKEPGYNFEYVAPAAYFPSVGWYAVRFTFTDSDSKVKTIRFEHIAR